MILKRILYSFGWLMVISASVQSQPIMDSLLARTDYLIKKADYPEALRLTNELRNLAEVNNDCFYEPMAIF